MGENHTEHASESCIYKTTMFTTGPCNNSIQASESCIVMIFILCYLFLPFVKYATASLTALRSRSQGQSVAFFREVKCFQFLDSDSSLCTRPQRHRDTTTNRICYFASWRMLPKVDETRTVAGWAAYPTVVGWQACSVWACSAAPSTTSSTRVGLFLEHSYSSLQLIISIFSDSENY